MKTPLILAALLSLIAPRPVTAQPTPAAPVVLRIEGCVGAPPHGTITVATWRVSVGERVFDLTVTKLRTLSGPLAPFTVIKRLEPYPVALSIAGDPQMIEELVSSRDGKPIVITGILQIEHASRVLTVSKVESNAPPTPARELGSFNSNLPPDSGFGAAPPPPAE